MLQRALSGAIVLLSIGSLAMHDAQLRFEQGGWMMVVVVAIAIIKLVIERSPYDH